MQHGVRFPRRIGDERAGTMKSRWFSGLWGHTHNGNDAVHFVHNNIAGNYVSITPAELFHNYGSTPGTMQPHVLNLSLWNVSTLVQSRYLPYLRGAQGFTSTTIDEAYVRAIRFTRNEDGQCEMHFKGSPSCPDVVRLPTPLLTPRALSYVIAWKSS